MSFAADLAWSERFIPKIRSLVGPFILAPASLEEDRLEATDLVVLNARDRKIACRVRKPGYETRYPNEFTIRSARASGTKTELRKIVEGFGDWMFYAHARSESEIGRWWLIDLVAFRCHYSDARDQIRHGTKPNGDGTWFEWFDITSFPPQPRILIAEGCAAEASPCPVPSDDDLMQSSKGIE